MMAQTPTTIEVAANAVATTSAALYTEFELLKNSKFNFCTVNSRTVADLSTTDFIVRRNVLNQSDFCSFMAGVPVMIPTNPTETAFSPSYPTIISQAASIGLSYVGLFFIVRYLDRTRMLPYGNRLPWYFWPILLLDFVRQVAFMIKTAQGFMNPNQLMWINALLWLIPLNYVFLASYLHTARKDQAYELPYKSSSIQFAALFRSESLKSSVSGNRKIRKPRHRPFAPIQKITRPLSLNNPNSPHSPEAYRKEEVSEIIGPYRSSFPNSESSHPPGRVFGAKIFQKAPTLASLSKRTFRGTTTWIAIIAVAAQWFFTLFSVALHWRWSFASPTSAFTTYLPSRLAISNPSTIGNMPASCLAYLQSGKLLPLLPGNTTNTLSTMSTFGTAINSQAGSLFEHPQFSPSLMATLEFGISSLAMLVLYVWRRKDEPFDRAYRALYTAIGISAFLMLLSLIVAAGKAGSQGTGLSFTNDLQKTGGCTFAWLDMNGRLGYWDVAASRAERIVLAFLGVA